MRSARVLRSTASYGSPATRPARIILVRHGQSEGNVDHANAIGARGEVYMNIPANGSGQVQVTYQNALRTMAARSKDDAQTIPSGTLVQVVDHLGSMLIVEPLDFSSEE